MRFFGQSYSRARYFAQDLLHGADAAVVDSPYLLNTIGRLMS